MGLSERVGLGGPPIGWNALNGLTGLSPSPRRLTWRGAFPVASDRSNSSRDMALPPRAAARPASAVSQHALQLLA